MGPWVPFYIQEIPSGLGSKNESPNPQNVQVWKIPIQCHKGIVKASTRSRTANGIFRQG
jgi:hypothetical protein